MAVRLLRRHGRLGGRQMLAVAGCKDGRAWVPSTGLVVVILGNGIFIGFTA